jgi:hypothetical protein
LQWVTMCVCVRVRARARMQPGGGGGGVSWSWVQVNSALEMAKVLFIAHGLRRLSLTLVHCPMQGHSESHRTEVAASFATVGAASYQNGKLTSPGQFEPAKASTPLPSNHDRGPADAAAPKPGELNLSGGVATAIVVGQKRAFSETHVEEAHACKSAKIMSNGHVIF